MQAYENTSSRVVCWDSGFRHKCSRHEQTVENHPFNHTMQMMVPNSHTLNHFQKLLNHYEEQHFFHVGEGKMVDIIEIISKVNKTNRRIYALSIDTPLDRTNAFCAASNTVTLKLNAETYQQFGLTGTHYNTQSKKIAHPKYQYIVKIPFEKLDKPHTRACIERISKGTPIRFIIACYDNNNNPIIIESNNIKLEKRKGFGLVDPIIMKLPTSTKSRLPLLKPREEGVTAAKRLLHWVGYYFTAMFKNTCEDIKKPTLFHDIATHDTILQPLNEGGIFIKIEGYIPPHIIAHFLSETRKVLNESKQIQSTLYGLFLVTGFEDSPLSWKDAHHGYHLSGENDYLFTIFANSQIERYLLCQTLGQADSYS